MKTARLVIAALVLLANVSGVGAGDGDADVRNGAYWYQRALESMDALSDQQSELVANYSGGEPSPELRSVLRSMEPTLAMLRRGANQQYSDFGLDFSEGFSLMLPHLANLRQAARLLNAQAQVKMHDGDVRGAARDLASMYQMGGHMGDDRVLISALVGNAIFDYSDRTVQQAIDRGALDSVAAAELAKGVQQLDPNDPFGYVESIFSEQELFTATLREDLQTVEGTQKLAEMFINQTQDTDALAETFRNMDVDQELARIDRTMNEVVEIFLLDDPDDARARLDELEGEIESGAHGELVKLLMPAYGRIYDRMIEARETVAERRAMLEKLARGELDPMELANAAVIYKQAIDAMRALPEVQRAAICSLADQPSQQVDEEMRAALRSSEPVVDLLRRGSQLRRCEFEPLRRSDRNAIAPDYVLGMHELLKLLQADVIRLARSKDEQAAADRLAIGYRMVGHLGSDAVLASPLVAHHAFNGFTTQVRGGRATGLFAPQRELLDEAVQRIARRDPFGYINAVMETRKNVQRALMQYITEPPDDFDRDSVEQAVRGWQGDELLYVLVVLHFAEEQESREQRIKSAAAKAGGGAGAQAIDEVLNEQPTLTEQLAPLDDVFSLEAIDAAQRDVEQVLHQLRAADLAIIDDEKMPLIGHWLQRMREARADLREAYRLVEHEANNEAASTRARQ